MHDPKQMPERRDGYLPQEDDGVLGDGRSLMRLGADGSIDWCVQNLDLHPLFDLLLDAGEGGRVVVAPTEPFAVARDYREDSNMLKTAFATANGRAVLVEALNSGTAGQLPWAELARRVDGIEGEVTFRVEVQSTRRVRPRIER